MKKTIQTLEEKLQIFFESPFRTYALLAIIVIPIVIKISSPFYNEAFFENILVEAHGMIFDILILGVLFAWFAQGGEKQRDIKRYQEEIEDYRGWESDEAKYRIAGNIKRLNSLGVSNIDLHMMNLREADLCRLNLRNANLLHCKMEKACIEGTDFSGATLFFSDLSEAGDKTKRIFHISDIVQTNFKNAKLSGAKFVKASLREANFTDAHATDTDFSKADLMYADFSNANLYGAILHGADLRETILQNTNLKSAQYDNDTKWPDHFDYNAAGAIHKKDVEELPDFPF